MRKINNLGFWYRWHRICALLASVAVFLWASSAVVHPILSRIQPRPAQMTLPEPLLEHTNIQSLAQVFTHHHMRELLWARLITWENQPVYQIGLLNKNIIYVSAKTGEKIGTDQDYAADLARQFGNINVTQKINKAALITEFNDEYLPINRYLPVWKISFDNNQNNNKNNNLDFYIETTHSRLATINSPAKIYLTSYFNFAHRWDFLQDYPVLRVVILSVFLVSALGATIGGLTIWFKRRALRHASRSRLRYWHGQFGVMLSVFFGLFLLSGFWHLWQNFDRTLRPVAQMPHLPMVLAEIQGVPNIATLQNKTSWQIQKFPTLGVMQRVSALPKISPSHEASAHQHAEHHGDNHEKKLPIIQWITVANKTLSEKIIAQDLLQYYAQLDININNINILEKFSPKYGFIFKRLPVACLAKTNGGQWCVETRSQVLAQNINQLDGLEGWSFAYLHKWHFTKSNRDFWDFLLAFVALSIAGLSVSGIIIFIKKKY